MIYNLLILLLFNFSSEDNSFDHKFENRRVEISFSKTERDGRQIVVGKVLDKKNNAGFPGMNIYFKKKQGYGTVSNIDGSFELIIPDDKSRLHFSFLSRVKVVLELDDY